MPPPCLSNHVPTVLCFPNLLLCLLLFVLLSGTLKPNGIRDSKALLAELDSVADPEGRLELSLRGVFAGNIFDLGAAASEQLFSNAGSSFKAGPISPSGLTPREED